jgi:curved DNA-binding protein
MRNPYTVLGLPRDADADAIRKAFRKLARTYHPDVNQTPGAEERFKEVNAAHEVLGDPKKRKMYDRFGEAATKPGFQPGGPRWQAPGSTGGASVEDLLGSLFGGGFQRPNTRGADQSVELPVPYMTTILGGEQTIHLRRQDGRVDTLPVPIPAGAKDGGRIRLRGQGPAPRGGGPCGDVLVRLQVPDHPVLRRHGDDLEMDLPVTVLEALQGATITVPTPTGEVRLNVPPGARNGTRLRLKRRGVQRKRAPGHLYLVVRPEVPNTATEALIEAATALHEATHALRDGLKL